MNPTLKNKEIDTRDSNFSNKLLVKTSFHLTSGIWFKGSRSRGLR